MKKLIDLLGNEKIPGMKKLLRLMKLTVFFILISMGCVLAGKTYSQTKTLTLHMENSTVKEVLAEIEGQSEFRIMYSGKFVDVDREVSLDVKNQKIESVLNTLFAGTDVSYTVKDRFIVLVTPELMYEGTLAVMQQPAVSGKVTDSDNQPLPGVTVVVKGTTQGTVTNADGNYSLSNIPDDATLVFSFVGMRTQEVVVGNQTSINVTMVEETIGIEEVVAVGYGTMKKSDLTGSVIRADIESFREVPNTSIIQSLQGSVPGVQIGQVNRAGQDPSINVRGETTINGSKSPLIILDGVVYHGSIGDINPANIESVDVLKDASSKAVYGAQAANGVILFTTKGGKKSQKPTITYSAYYTMSEPTKNYRLLNRDEWLEKARTIEYMRSYTEGSGYTQPNPNWDYTQSQIFPAVIQGIESGTEFNWWDAATTDGYMHNHVVSVTGGGKEMSYFVSGGLTKQQALIINDKYSRANLRVNFDMNITDWLTVGTNTFLSFADFSGAVPSIDNIRTTAPVVAPQDDEGNWVINPLGDANINPLLNAEALDSDKRHQINLNNYAKISIPWVKGLTYRLNYNYALNVGNQAYFNEFGAGITGYAKKYVTNNYYMLLDNIVNYTRSFGTHDVNATFVYGYNQLDYDNTTAEGEGYGNTALGYNSLEQATNQYINSDAWEQVNLYQMGRIAYGYKNRYLITTTLRRDGFSGFAENNKFGLFPSVGAGWVISDEAFVEDALEYLKLRVSYGVTGNLTSRYSSLAKVVSDDGQKYIFGDGAATVNGQSVSSMANKDLSWETTYETNYGVDFTILNSKIRGSVDYYSSTTKDLLWDVVIPNMTGFSFVRTNLGELKNHGVEINLNTTPVHKGDLTWNLNVNFAHNKNEVVSLLGDDNDGDGVEDDLVASGLFIGEPLGTIYGYEVDGIWQIGEDITNGFFPGSYKIVDQAGPGSSDPDGEITAADDRIILGHENPLFTMGIMNKLDYKNFSLKFFLNIIEGGKNGYLKYNTRPLTTPGNLASHNLFNSIDMWSPSNPDAMYAIGWETPAINTDILQSRSFIRLQDISLSYTLSKNFANRIGLERAKVYLSGKNLLTFTNWHGWDPETGQGITSDAYPVMRSYTIGLDISF